MDGAGHSETKRLRHNVEWALRRALDPATVLPMLHRLSRLSADGSDENLYAQRRLAELLADHHPWRAALCARRVLARQPGDDGAWAILALCHALLGHHRCAVSAYRHAVDLAPDNAAYAHNLGHLLDVALGSPADALPWLRTAYELAGRRADVAASYAHALARSGDLALARQVSRRALKAADAASLGEHLALARWLEDGAPDEARLLPRRPPASGVTAPWKREPRRRRPRRGGSHDARARELEALVARGLTRLPLDAKQRGRARSIAREPAVLALLADDSVDTSSVAGAVAYAAVYLEHVPLTQGEVAACFRVSVPALRGMWKTLRALIDLTPGEPRAATPRP